MRQVVAIDGPSGSGKSTVAALLAEELGYMHLDTGAMYRTVALAAAREDIPFDDGQRLDELCGRIRIEMRPAGKGISIFLNGEDVSDAIRNPEMSRASSAVSSVPQVRRQMVRLQREIGARGGVVAEGRDMGTVVFPETTAKFYLVASLEERARRRWLQLKDFNIVQDQGKVMEEMAGRDRQDSAREHSPLKKAEDAITIDTTGMSIEEVVSELSSLVREVEEKDA